MKIFFDFDHTLFSTKKFYQAFQKAFEKLGIDEKLFQETYNKSKGREKIYNPEKQFKLILKIKPEINLKRLEKTFKKILNQTFLFLYPDTVAVLKKLKKNNDLIILSYSKAWFQRKKIKESKIEDFFKKIFITQDANKDSVFKKNLRKKEKAIFVEDNPTALLKNKNNFPNLITVRINRGEGRYTGDSDNSKIDFSIKNLKELEKIVKNLK